MTTRRTPAPRVSGVLNLDKPIGMTSRDAVDLVARPLRGNKVGHAGTLDPLASGVLVVCVGAATRLIEYVQRLPKTYRTVVRLGARSDTLDADGRVVEAIDPPVPDEARVRDALAGQVGTIEQLPPQYSALKVGGRRAYDLARAGQEVELAPRPVRIDRVDLLSYAWPRLELEIDCGAGTYIRSIARDVGEALGCGGLVEVLTRTRIGPFTLADAVDPRTLPAAAIPGLLRPVADAVPGLPRVRLSPDQLSAVARGLALPLRELAPASLAGGELALLGPDGALVAIAEADPAGGVARPRRVLIS
jgi:tRNA pseudouridine55 synthase